MLGALNFLILNSNMKTNSMKLGKIDIDKTIENITDNNQQPVLNYLFLTWDRCVWTFLI